MFERHTQTHSRPTQRHAQSQKRTDTQGHTDKDNRQRIEDTGNMKERIQNLDTLLVRQF